MQVKDIGEARLIQTLEETLASEATAFLRGNAHMGFRLRLSVGDDAAAWDGPAGARVLTADAMVEGVHFDLHWIGWADLGWKSLAVNLSDIATMGCTPLYSVVTLGLRGDLPVSGLVQMYRGMMDACRQYGGAVVGGDIVRSPTFFVAVAMVGVATESIGGGPGEQPLLTRRSAKSGDKIAVTGSLGCSGGGLRMYQQGLSFDDETSAHLRAALNRPMPRVTEGILLARHGVVSAIDVSDGLVDDLRKLCKASGVGAVVHSDRVPADKILKRAYPDDWLSLALSAGEDYQLLFTAPLQVVERVTPLLKVPVSVIGDVVEESQGVTVLDEDGDVISVERGGWDHFRSRYCPEE